jgi:glycosyltransferase involved in cell wall biosynthesis
MDYLYYLNYLQNIHWEDFPTYQIALYSVFAAAFLIQAYYYLNVFRCATRATPLPQSTSQPPVSVVIYSTNEYENLNNNLPLFLEQKYPRFDVIVINDCSTDKSEELLSTLKMRYKNLYYSNVEKNDRFKHDRKLAITLGIKASQYDNIIFTAPNCIPPNNEWLAAMQAGFASQPHFVLGHCNYTALSAAKRCDAIYTQLFAIYAARKGFPFYASYKNLGINRTMFLDSKGFANMSRLQNSEETMFICRKANAKNTIVNLAAGSIMSCSQRLTFRQWWRQRITQSALFALGGRGQTIRHLEMLSRALFYLAEVALAVLTYGNYVPVVSAALLVLPLTFIRLYLQAIVFRRIKKVWKERNILAGLFLYDRWSPILALIIALCRPNLYKIKSAK